MMKIKIKKATAKHINKVLNNIMDLVLTLFLTIGLITLGSIAIWVSISEQANELILIGGLLLFFIGIYFSFIILEDIFIEYIE